MSPHEVRRFHESRPEELEYKSPAITLHAQERFIERKPERREHGPLFYLAWSVGPMLLTGLGAIMFWLGYR